jgi:class 3 adenylate cyclase
VRKTVTVVFADVTGSTALADRLDPEAVWHVMSRYFEVMREPLERHGGTVEKFIGDAVMAVFGVPVVHEDDALRAVRAAVEMRDALAALNVELERKWDVTLAARIGVNSGEVVAGDPAAGQSFATGDAINVAARLEQAAAPGEILLGEAARGLLDGRVTVEPVEPLALKGKSAPVRAFRVLGVEADAPPPPPPVGRSPFVGREAELRLLRESFDRCVEEHACRLVTVLGPPGIGKSRLVREALDGVASRGSVLVGRCPPYGEGITYLPLLDIVRQLAPSGAVELAALVAGEKDGERVADLVAGALGLSPTRVPSEETQWAVRRLFEALARRRPLVVALDDVHWAEPTFLELVEHVVALARGAPILVVCLARPELLDARPSWGARGGGGDTIQLEPLAGDDARALVERGRWAAGVSPDIAGRVLEAAEGNPLFLEQLLAVQTEDGENIGVPPTIQAVLAARIDRLPSAERLVIQRAAVQGRVFSRGALAELVPGEEPAEVDDALGGLERRELVRRDRRGLGGEDAFRFAHGLIRDAAYQFLRKETRSELHERLAWWLERTAARELGEQEELVGYHFEQAYVYRAELGPVGEGEFRLASEAATRLDASGRRALSRSDFPAAIKLLERAAALLAHDDRARADILACLGAALTETGGLADARRVLEDAIRSARTIGDERLEAHARVEELSLDLQVETHAATSRIRSRGEPIRQTFEAHDDDIGLCKLWRLRGLVHWLECHSAAADAAWGQAAEHAREAGDRRKFSDILLWLASSALVGPLPARFAIRRCEAMREEVTGDRYARAWILRPLAALHAMEARFDVARALLEESRCALAELGVTLSSASGHEEARVAMLAGDPAAAERCLRDGYEKLEAMGEKALLSSTAAELAEAVYSQGRYDEAGELTEASEALAAPDDVSAQVVWRGVRAKVLAKRGYSDDAERLARNGVALAEQTDWLNMHGDALLDLGEVLAEHGAVDAAETAVLEALRCYEKKGNVVSAGNAQSRTSALVRA